MTTHTARIHRVLNALLPIQTPNLKPWSPDSYAHRPNVLVRSLGMIALIGLMGFGLSGMNEPDMPAEIATIQSDENVHADIIDDLVDLFEELMGTKDDEEDEDGSNNG